MSKLYLFVLFDSRLKQPVRLVHTHSERLAKKIRMRDDVMTEVEIWGYNISTVGTQAASDFLRGEC